MKKLIFEVGKKKRYAYKEEIKVNNKVYGDSFMSISSTLILKKLENYQKLGMAYSAVGIREKDLEIKMKHDIVKEYLMFRSKLSEYIFILVDESAELQCILNNEDIKEKTQLFFELMKKSTFDGYFETVESDKKIIKKIIENEGYENLLQFSRGLNSLFIPVIYKENLDYNNIFYINDLIPGGSIPLRIKITGEKDKKQITGTIDDVYFDKIQFGKVIKKTFFYDKMKDCNLNYIHKLELDESDGFIKNGNLLMKIQIDNEIEVEKKIFVNLMDGD